MLKVENGKFSFMGSGGDFVDEMRVVFKAFLISSMNNFDMKEQEAVVKLMTLVGIVVSEFIEEQKK